MERIIGIDLGTTNSCVAAVVDGVPTVFANRGGYKTTPSMFAVAKNGKRVVGHIAKRQAVTNAEGTVHAIKRLIGRKWDSEARVRAAESVPYVLVEGPTGDIRVRIGDEILAIPEISSQILTEMRRVAEAAMEDSVHKAVVTVPAYFNDAQRQATKDAGKIAGLEVIRIINEPTAAALAYGFGKELERKIAVFDMGGGTFDISILQISGGVFDVVATAGDSFLGGEDFDERIIEWLVFNFAKEHRVDLRKDKMALQRLKDVAEKAKCELSSATSAEINLPFIYSTGQDDALHLQRSLSREKLEDLVDDLIERSLVLCERTLKEAGLSKEDLDEVLLVGGQTRMPRIQKRVKEIFGKDPSKGVHPDEVVALGAAIQGSLLVEDTGASEMLLLDVTPMSLGIMIVGGYFQVLISKNTTVPTSATHTFTTVSDGQTNVKILVLQGESELAAENELLGEFMLTGLRAAPRGEVEIDVTFEISADGIVSVKARDSETGLQQAITVTATHGLSEDELRDIVDRNADFMLEAREDERFEASKTDMERLAREIERLFPQVEDAVRGTDFGTDAVKKARAALERARAAVEARDLPAIEKSKESLERTVTLFKGVLSRMRGG
ncbi:MAG: molecular chaperone DnaK [Deltaproteobacteria bacterium]|nr:molecular chaperone DnaK [Deltaproteobacteria bacterium]